MSASDLWLAPRATEPVDLVVSLPGSKSLTNRALILAALSDGPSVVRRALRSRDTTLMADALVALGTRVDTSGEDWLITPSAWTCDARIDVGLAGTVMRFVPPVAVLSRGTIAFDGDAHMRNRPVGEILAALRGLGATIDADSLPFTVTGRGSMPGGTVVTDASASSQFISALLLAGARYDRGVDVLHDGKPVPSLPHIEMTIQMLGEHGVEVDDSEANRWRVAPSAIKAADHEIEPDLSNAGPFLALAAVTGGRVRVAGWPETTTQAGDALRDILTEMGCSVSLDPDGLTVVGPPRLQGTDVDLHDVGELTPVVAALAALAHGPSHLRGIGHIRGHETDRLAALSTELSGLGANVVEHADGLAFTPATLSGGTFHTYADHRMAHAAVIVGAAVDGVQVENIATTSKTFPDFDRFWSGLLGDRRRAAAEREPA